MKINYEVNGIKYMLFELVIPNKEQALILGDELLDYKGIMQSYIIITSFWNLSVKVKVLIPEIYAIEFSKSKKHRI